MRKKKQIYLYDGKSTVEHESVGDKVSIKWHLILVYSSLSLSSSFQKALKPRDETRAVMVETEVNPVIRQKAQTTKL